MSVKWSVQYCPSIEKDLKHISQDIAKAIIDDAEPDPPRKKPTEQPKKAPAKPQEPNEQPEKK